MRSGSQQCVIVAPRSALSRLIPRVQIASGRQDSVHVLVHVGVRQHNRRDKQSHQTPAQKNPKTVVLSQTAAHLYNVKVAWRNRVMHPHDVYTLEEAEGLRFILHLVVGSVYKLFFGFSSAVFTVLTA